MADRPLLSAMDSSYASHARSQRLSFDHIVPAVLAAALEMQDVPELRVMDLGAADGVNSHLLIEILMAVRAGRPLVYSFVDMPTNGWDAARQHLREHRNSELASVAVVPSVDDARAVDCGSGPHARAPDDHAAMLREALEVGGCKTVIGMAGIPLHTSPSLPEGMVHLAVSGTAMHWVEAPSDLKSSGSVFPGYSNSVAHEVVAWRLRAADQWMHLLRMRAQELAPGGWFIAALPASATGLPPAQGSETGIGGDCYRAIARDMNEVLAQWVREGKILQETADLVVAPVWVRSPAEIRAPFEAGGGAVNGLQLERLELFRLDNPYANEDPLVFARDYVQSCMAWGMPLYMEAFRREGENVDRVRLIRDFVMALEARVAADPDRHRFDFTQALVACRKQSLHGNTAASSSTAPPRMTPAADFVKERMAAAASGQMEADSGSGSPESGGADNSPYVRTPLRVGKGHTIKDFNAEVTADNDPYVKTPARAGKGHTIKDFNAELGANLQATHTDEASLPQSHLPLGYVSPEGYGNIPRFVAPEGYGNIPRRLQASHMAQRGGADGVDGPPGPFGSASPAGQYGTSESSISSASLEGKYGPTATIRVAVEAEGEDSANLHYGAMPGRAEIAAEAARGAAVHGAVPVVAAVEIDPSLDLSQFVPTREKFGDSQEFSTADTAFVGYEKTPAGVGAGNDEITIVGYDMKTQVRHQALAARAVQASGPRIGHTRHMSLGADGSSESQTFQGSQPPPVPAPRPGPPREPSNPLLSELTSRMAAGVSAGPVRGAPKAIGPKAGVPNRALGDSPGPKAIGPKAGRFGGAMMGSPKMAKRAIVKPATAKRAIVPKSVVAKQGVGRPPSSAAAAKAAASPRHEAFMMSPKPGQSPVVGTAAGPKFGEPIPKNTKADWVAPKR